MSGAQVATRFAGFVVFLALAACTVSPSAPAFKTDRDRAELKGPVKTVSVNFKDMADKFDQNDERHLGSTTYDRAGNFIEDEDVTPDFIKKRRAERLDTHTVLFHSVMGDMVERDVYDAQGNAPEEAFY